VEIIVENIEISKKLDELVSLTEQDVAIQEYKEIEAVVYNDPKLQHLTKEIKKYQQTSVLAAHFQQEKTSESAGKRADNLHNELANNPLAMEYNEKLKNADDLLQHIMHLLENEIQKTEG
jgi:cell fate (sporulation/competence/biofilm development) regulator YmcA (YheA/YmcA/DUF963 family)